MVWGGARGMFAPRRPPDPARSPTSRALVAGACAPPALVCARRDPARSPTSRALVAGAARRVFRVRGRHPCAGSPTSGTTCRRSFLRLFLFGPDSMPLAFAAIPGLAGFPLVVARGLHPVEATGAAVVLATMVPAFLAIAGPGPAISFFFEFPQVYWLLLPAILADAGFPRNGDAVSMTVIVTRLGVAVECLIANGLNTAPCSPSVARKRIHRLAVTLRAGPLVAQFRALAAEAYMLEMPPLPAPPPPGGAVAGVVPAAASPTAAAALIGIFIGTDGSFTPLADAEPIMFPRFAVAQRGAGSGVDFFFEPWRASIVASLPAAMVAAIPDVDVANQIGARFRAHLPDEMLASLMPPMEARMAHV